MVDMKVWKLQTQIQVLTNKLKQINVQRRRLRSQAPYIKQGLITAEQYGELRGMLRADQYNKIIKDEILCMFSDNSDFGYKVIATLDKRDNSDGYFFSSQGVWYRYCKPFNQLEFNIAKI